MSTATAAQFAGTSRSSSNDEAIEMAQYAIFLETRNARAYAYLSSIYKHIDYDELAENMLKRAEDLGYKR